MRAVLRTHNTTTTEEEDETEEDYRERAKRALQQAADHRTEMSLRVQFRECHTVTAISNEGDTKASSMVVHIIELSLYYKIA